jgi:pimeloyl-ACP methyl ester carboxylesterase
VRFPRLTAALLLCSTYLAADSREQQFSDFTTPLPVAAGETVVLGVVGGWERWDNPVRAIRRTAVLVKRQRLAGVHVETVEHRRLELAETLLRRAFDFNADGRLTRDEAVRARVVIYGQSLGGRAALWLCRTLEGWGVPVRLLIVVDGFGRDSYVVPANVREAANYFQREHFLLKGAAELRRADPSRTTIVENREISFEGRDDVEDREEGFVKRFIFDEYVRMDYVPELWSRIEQLITSAAAARD